jgi:hypothetical protein
VAREESGLLESLGQEADLLELARGRVEHDVRRSSSLERCELGPQVFAGGQRVSAGGGEELVPVVVADVVVCKGVGVIAESEVSAGRDLRLPWPSSLAPGPPYGCGSFLEHGQPEQRSHPSVALRGCPLEGRRHQPSEQEGGAPVG